MVRVGDQPRNYAKDCEWLYLHMGSCSLDVGLVESYQGIYLLIYVKVLDDSFLQKVIEANLSEGQIYNMLLIDERLSPSYDD